MYVRIHTHVVVLLLWSMKKTLPPSVRDIVQPGGSGSSSDVPAAVTVLVDAEDDTDWNIHRKQSEHKVKVSSTTKYAAIENIYENH